MNFCESRWGRAGVCFLLLTATCFTLMLSSCVPARRVDLDDPLTGDVQKGIASGESTFSHAGFDALLRKHVRETGRVDYAGLVTDRETLSAYLRSLAGANIASLSRDELLAFLINAYNAYTLDVVTRNYPLESIKEIDPWATPFCEVGGYTVSLNDIEHKLLRPSELFDDPRMHFAINCASIGCPFLRPGAYDGENIDRQLEEAVSNCLTDSRYAKADGNGVAVSKILNWFKGDFTDKHGSLSGFMKPYVSPDIRSRLEKNGDGGVRFLDYDWNLNDTATSPKS